MKLTPGQARCDAAETAHILYMNDGPAQRQTPETTNQALTPYDPERFERDQEEVEGGFWRKVQRVASHVPFIEDAIAAYYCARDRATPIQAKAVIMGALAYFVIPVDVIPDFLTGLGFTDDATVFYIAYQAISNHVTERHREKAREALSKLRG